MTDQDSDGQDRSRDQHDRKIKDILQSGQDWKFDQDGNMVDAQGGVLAPAGPVLQYLSNYQQQFQGFYSGELASQTIKSRQRDHSRALC